MNKRIVFISSCALGCTLAVALVAQSLSGGALMPFFNSNSKTLGVSAYDGSMRNWQLDIKNDCGASGSLSYSGDGQLVHVEDCPGNSLDAWFVKLANYSIPTTAGSTYKATFNYELDADDGEGTNRTVIVNGAKGTQFAREDNVADGSHLISTYVYATDSVCEVELQLGGISGNFDVTVKSFTMEKFDNLVTSIEAKINAYDDSAANVASNSGNTISYTVTAKRSDGENKGVWSTQLQSKLKHGEGNVTLESGHSYTLRYSLSVSNAAAFNNEDGQRFELLYCDSGMHPFDEQKYDYKVYGDMGADGEWSGNYVDNTDARIFQQSYNGHIDSRGFYIDFRAGNIQLVPVTITFGNIYLYDNVASETRTLAYESVGSWLNDWDAMRTALNNGTYVYLDNTHRDVLSGLFTRFEAFDSENQAMIYDMTERNAGGVTYGQSMACYQLAIQYQA